MPMSAKEKILHDLFRRNPPQGDTQQLGPFRTGRTYRYLMANGCKRQFRVLQIFLGGFFDRAKPDMLIEYLDSGLRGYVSADATRLRLA